MEHKNDAIYPMVMLLLALAVVVIYWLLAKPYVNDWLLRSSYITSHWCLSGYNTLVEYPIAAKLYVHIVGGMHGLDMLKEMNMFLRDYTSYNPKNMPFNDTIMALRFSSAPFSFALALIFFFYIFRTLSRRTAPFYARTVFNLKSLALANAEQYPWIKPAIQANLLNQNQYEGPWRKALTPIETLAEWKCLIGFDNKDGIRTGSKSLIISKQVNIDDADREFAKEHKMKIRHESLRPMTKFAEKWHGHVEIELDVLKKKYYEVLGDKWTGFDDLSQVEQLIYVAHLAFASHTRKNKGIKKGLALLDHVSNSWETAKNKASFEYPDYMSVYEEFKGNEVEKKITERFGYKYTVLMGLRAACIPNGLSGFKGKGKLPPSRFLFLKVVDRKLWLTLDSVLSSVTWSEVKPIESHFSLEAEVGGYVEEPDFSGGIDSFILYVSDIEGWIEEKD